MEITIFLSNVYKYAVFWHHENTEVIQNSDSKRGIYLLIDTADISTQRID